MPESKELREQLAEVERKIAKLEGQKPRDEIGGAFHLGRVGGSGRAVKSLDKRRERDLDKTIDLAKKLTPLYEQHNRLLETIPKVESGEAERKQKARQEAKAAADQRMLDWFDALAVGDEIPMGNAPMVVTKKNRKSVVSTSGTKWTRAELTGVKGA